MSQKLLKCYFIASYVTITIACSIEVQELEQLLHVHKNAMKNNEMSRTKFEESKEL